MMRAILVLLLFLFSLAGANDEGTHVTSDSIYNTQNQWTDMNGTKTSLDKLKGKVHVIAMAYTSCQYACPLIMADMKKIENGLPKNIKNNVEFNLFSFDPKRDTPAVLKKYLKKRDLDVEHWRLFTTSEVGVRELAALLGIKYKKTSNGEFGHSNIIFVLDQDGVMKRQQVGLNQDPTETISFIKQLIEKKEKL